MKGMNDVLIKVQNKVNSMDTAKRMKYAKITRLSMTVVVCLSAILAFGIVGFAAGSTTGTGDIAQSIADGMESFYNLLKAITIPVAAVAVAAAAFQIFAGGEKGMEKAKKIVIYTAIGIGIAYLGPWLVKTIAGWFGNNTGGAFTV